MKIRNVCSLLCLLACWGCGSSIEEQNRYINGGMPDTDPDEFQLHVQCWRPIYGPFPNLSSCQEASNGEVINCSFNCCQTNACRQGCEDVWRQVREWCWQFDVLPNL